MWGLSLLRRRASQDDVVVVTKAVGLVECGRLTGHGLRVPMVLMVL